MNAKLNGGKIVIELGRVNVEVSEKEAESIRCGIAAKVFPKVDPKTIPVRPRLLRMGEDARNRVDTILANTVVDSGKLRIDVAGIQIPMTAGEGLRLWRSFDNLRLSEADRKKQDIADLDLFADDEFTSSLD